MIQPTDRLHETSKRRLIDAVQGLMQRDRTACAVTPIPGTEPPQYVDLGTAEDITKLLAVPGIAGTPARLTERKSLILQLGQNAGLAGIAQLAEPLLTMAAAFQVTAPGPRACGRRWRWPGDTSYGSYPLQLQALHFKWANTPASLT